MGKRKLLIVFMQCVFLNSCLKITLASRYGSDSDEEDVVIKPHEIKFVPEEYLEPRVLGLYPGDEYRLKFAGRPYGVGPYPGGRSLIGTIYSSLSQVWGKLTRDTPSTKKERAKLTRYMIRDQRSPNWNIIKRDGSNAKQFWNKGGKVKIMIHGFTPSLSLSRTERVKQSQFFEIGDAYASLQKGYNLIIVDWTELSSYPDLQYYHAVEGSKFVGPEIGNFLKRLKNRGLITSWDNVHVIGFSLGGQIAGMVGHWIKNNAGGPVARITGIDPAGPLFSNYGELPRDRTNVLDSSDAAFVDVIHCNMGKMVKTLNIFQNGRLGTAAQSGHADFYPNGGEKQPNCDFWADSLGSCSHNTCPTYFLHSIKRNILSCPCDSWYNYAIGRCSCTQKNGMYFGERCTTKAKGKYYLSLS